MGKLSLNSLPCGPFHIAVLVGLFRETVPKKEIIFSYNLMWEVLSHHFVLFCSLELSQASLLGRDDKRSKGHWPPMNESPSVP